MTLQQVAKIPFANEFVHINNVPHIAELCKRMVPALSSVPNEEIGVSELTGGITNKLYEIKHAPKEVHVLCRLYGKNTELIIDRERELALMAKIHKKGLGARVYCRFQNGYIYDYIPGEPLSVDDMPKKARGIAHALAHLHSINLDTDRTPVLFETLYKWLKIAKSLDFENETEKQAKFAAVDLNILESELRDIERNWTDNEVRFSHNDLLCLNIIYDSERDVFNFIDMEYCGYNYRSFDIANHFCEYLGFDVEEWRFPSAKQQLLFLEEYLYAGNGFAAPPKTEELFTLFAQVRKASMMPHLYWGLWALTQARFSEIDFDYLSYAMTKISLFKQCRETISNETNIAREVALLSRDYESQVNSHTTTKAAVINNHQHPQHAHKNLVPATAIVSEATEH